MNEEQQYINLIFNHLQNGNTHAMENLIPQIDMQFKHSSILNYYIAYYYEKVNKIDSAISRFKRCIELSPYFVFPYFHLANYYLERDDHVKLEELLSKIFNKKTTDLKTTTKREFYLDHQLQIVNMLGPTYMRSKSYSKSIKLYTKALEFLGDYTPSNKFGSFEYIQNFKTFSLALGESYAKSDPEKSISYYSAGLILDENNDTHQFTQLNKKLFSGFALTFHYAKIDNTGMIKKVTSKVNQIYNYNYNNNKDESKNKKIRIGYISPDFNRNAVGLFVTPLLKYFDRTKFEVHIYYTNGSSDQFTELFKSFHDIIWTNISSMSDIQAYNLMKNDHQLDILVDLIASGSQNRLELIGMKPAKYIVNYLGYPSTSFFSAYTHRIVDNFTDPITEKSFHETIHCEKLIRLPRLFLCFSLHSIVKLPILEYTSNDDSSLIKIGIVNKSNKWSSSIKNCWKDILDANPNVVFYVKETENDQNELPFSNKRMKIIPFKDTLEGYLSIFNDLDFCLDTTPYSGTTTTCTSLLMGVPVFTIYDPNKSPHVSNVSGSILINCGLTNFVTKDVSDYLKKVNEFIKSYSKLNSTQKLQNKMDIQSRFLKAMDPQLFMKEYEMAISNLDELNLSYLYYFFIIKSNNK